MQFFFFILAITFFYLLLKPLLNVFLASIILAYVFYPLFGKIKNYLKYENISILITLILIIIIFLMPFVFIASQIPKQTASIYTYFQDNIAGKGLFSFNCKNSDSYSCNIFNFANEQGVLNFNKIIDSAFSKMTQAATYIVISIPNIIVSIALALFISFFLFKDGKRMINAAIRLMPLDKKHSNSLVEKFGKVTHSVVFAHIIVAIVQGSLGAIGFYIFGISSPIFWGVIMAIFALIPLIGTAIVWVPASIFLLINGIIANSYLLMGKAIGLFLFGIFIISTIDNILRVKIIGGSADVHPLTVLIGIIGGISLFGLTGIFIGPIALSLLITFFNDFRGEYA
ncbi:hypothetical protein CL615_00685 [archaeon]|jgi:predicted PurR-regulated permease PerM|nr:hypothetical protein [archaeon]MDP6547683.1 AI-2E family transporter [Candidatus Woesearchaeota archaeon]|tara:strand:- start:18322 stop:19344 length:1023 start_codon:yes stop_codon:yes gene_type:complete